MARKQGLELIVVPCWWEGDLERYVFFSFYFNFSFLHSVFFPLLLPVLNHLSFLIYYIYLSHSLAASIWFQRPDLSVQHSSISEPIASNPPHNFFQRMPPFLFFLSFSSLSPSPLPLLSPFSLPSLFSSSYN